jgi:hypothetical protein
VNNGNNGSKSKVHGLTTQNGENQRNHRLREQQRETQQEHRRNLSKAKEDGQQKGQQTGTARKIKQCVVTCSHQSQPKPSRTRGKHNHHARRHGQTMKYRVHQAKQAMKNTATIKMQTASQQFQEWASCSIRNAHKSKRAGNQCATRPSMTLDHAIGKCIEMHSGNIKQAIETIRACTETTKCEQNQEQRTKRRTQATRTRRKTKHKLCTCTEHQESS